MTELDSRIKLRSSLRCDGIGRLDCAEDLESGQRLAVRWLPLEANGEAAVKACERLPQHPMLPRIRQTGKMGSMAFLALDFPEGSLLSTILGDRLDTGVVLQMAAQLADALATVHGQGVVHGEFGSDSVLMVGDKSYLWDLPLVIANRLTDRRGENRLMQNLVRVVPYLAPERARGAGASCEADVYSLGALLCICAGAPMPADSTTLGTVYSIAQGQWVPRVPSTIPQPYHAMIEKMISADATERPAAQDVAKLFSQPMHSGALPTVPDMPMIRLPPELQARANALLKSPPPVPEPVESELESEVSSAEVADVPSSEAEVATAATPIEAAADREMIETPVGVPAVALAPVPAPIVEQAVVSVAAAEVVEAPVVVAPVADVAAPVVETVEPVQASAAFAPLEPVVAAAPASIAVAEEKVIVSAPVTVAVAAELDEVPEAAANDVLRLPTIEMPKVMVVESTPAVMLAPEPSRSVALTDSVSVSPELVQAGAGMFSLYTEPPKQSMGMWWVAGGAVVTIISLLVFAVNMVGKATAEKALAPHSATVAPAAPAPVEAAPVAPAAQPVELKEVAPAAPEAEPSPAAVQPAPAAPAAVPETGSLVPARSPVVEATKDDVLAPLARAKGGRAAAKHARKSQSIAAPVMPAPTKVTAAVAEPSDETPLAPLSAHGTPVEYAPVAVKTPAVPPSPDDFFPEAPVKPSRADAKQPTP